MWAWQADDWTQQARLMCRHGVALHAGAVRYAAVETGTLKKSVIFGQMAGLTPGSKNSVRRRNGSTGQHLLAGKAKRAHQPQTARSDGNQRENALPAAETRWVLEVVQVVTPCDRF